MFTLSASVILAGIVFYLISNIEESYLVKMKFAVEDLRNQNEKLLRLLEKTEADHKENILKLQVSIDEIHESLYQLHTDKLINKKEHQPQYSENPWKRLNSLETRTKKI